MKFISLILGVIFLMTSVSSLQSQTPLTLKECIQITVKNNSQLKNAKRNMLLAKSGVRAAYANILPQVDSDIRIGKTHQAEVEYLQDVPVEYEQHYVNIPLLDPVTGDTTLIAPFPMTGRPTRYEQQLISQDAYDRKANSFNLNLGQNIFDGGKWWNRIRKAKADNRGAEYSYEMTKQQIILTAKQYYYYLLKQIALLKVYEESHGSYNEQYKRTQTMYEIGSVAQADVYKARVSLGEALSNLIKQRNAVNVAKYNLNFVMARGPKTPIEIAEEEVNFTANSYENIEAASAIEANPEIQVLRENIASTKFSHKIAKGNFWPTITAGASYSRFSPELQRVYKGYDKNYSWYAGFSMSFNLFRGFADKANKDIEKLNYLNAQENYQERKRGLAAEIAEYNLNLQANQELIKINKENLVSAEEDFRLAQERYRVGSGTLLDVLLAQVSVTQARSSLISAKYDAVFSQAQLEAALGILKK